MNIMWGFTSRRDSPPQQSSSNGGKGHNTNGSNSNGKNGFGRRGGRSQRGGGKHPRAQAQAHTLPTLRTTPVAPPPIEEMNVAETKHGIEVSLGFQNPVPDDDDDDESAEESATQMSGTVLSIDEQIRQRQKVHRSQFSVCFPVLEKAMAASLFVSPSLSSKSRSRNHRVAFTDTRGEQTHFDDMANLLQNRDVESEISAVTEELSLMVAEIEALEEDRTRLEKHGSSFVGFTSNTSVYSMTTNLATNSNLSGSDSFVWDVRRLLSRKQSLSLEEQRRLQELRGMCLTLHLHHTQAQEVFITKCGSASKSRQRRKVPDTVTLGPDNCRPGGAGASIRHVSILSDHETGSKSAFFISKDSSKSFTWGHLPPRLFRRMKQQGLDPHHDGGDLVYLSTGPHGCYYAEFRSGESWWGNPFNDTHFHSILNEWDIYRVTFGPIFTYRDENGVFQAVNSWIVLSRDGRAAWKNLPARLHNTLESRLPNWAAPAEVALGSGGSYFIRFLDGTTDYCLPYATANICDTIERNGARITDMAMHPEKSMDFVIRHTQMASS